MSTSTKKFRTDDLTLHYIFSSHKAYKGMTASQQVQDLLDTNPRYVGIKDKLIIKVFGTEEKPNFIHIDMSAEDYKIEAHKFESAESLKLSRSWGWDC